MSDSGMFSETNKRGSLEALGETAHDAAGTRVVKRACPVMWTLVVD